MNLREHVRELQMLENKTAEKSGMRFMLLDEKKLFGKDAQSEIAKFIRLISVDIFPEMIKAAKMGKELNAEIAKE